MSTLFSFVLFISYTAYWYDSNLLLLTVLTTQMHTFYSLDNNILCFSNMILFIKIKILIEWKKQRNSSSWYRQHMTPSQIPKREPSMTATERASCEGKVSQCLFYKILDSLSLLCKGKLSSLQVSLVEHRMYYSEPMCQITKLFPVAASEGNSKPETLDLFKYFSSQCFSGFSDSEKGFYTVYRWWTCCIVCFRNSLIYLPVKEE